MKVFPTPTPTPTERGKEESPIAVPMLILALLAAVAVVGMAYITHYYQQQQAQAVEFIVSSEEIKNEKVIIKDFVPIEYDDGIVVIGPPFLPLKGTVSVIVIKDGKEISRKISSEGIILAADNFSQLKIRVKGH